MKETNSFLDIGFHYVAVDGNGLPSDTDEDGLPDYADPDHAFRSDIVWSNSVWSWKTDSLAWNCWTNALACTNGQGDFYKIYSSFSTPTNRNTNFWLRHFKGWPAYSVWHDCGTNLWPTNTSTSCSGDGDTTTYQCAGTLVSPEHVLTAGHMFFSSNTWLVFMDMSNNVVFRQIRDYFYRSTYGGEPTNNLTTNMPVGEYYIGLLDQPVPETIGYMRVIPTNLWAWFDAPFYNNATNYTYHVPMFVENCQHRTPVMVDLVTLNCSTQCNPSSSFAQLTLNQWSHWTSQGGDCGSPWCCVLDGELCLAYILGSTLSFGVYGTTDPADMHARVNAVMRELSLRNGRTNIYALEVKDLSNFPMYRPSCVCSP